MSAHNVTVDLFHAESITADPGASGVITVDESPTICHLTSATTETRTLARPTRQGAEVFIHMQTDGGDVTLTVTGGYNETGNTTFVFSDPGQWILLKACQSSAGTFFWQKISDYGTGNLTAAAAASGLTAVVGVAAGYKLARGETALDGGNPTTVATGLTTIVGLALTLKGTAAPGVGTSVLTANISTTNIDVYAWKVTGTGDCTLIASTGTETFYWVAVGT